MITSDDRRLAVARYPLSFTQEALWLQEQNVPGLTAANMVTTVQFEGALDVGILERSLNDIVQRHEILRSTFDSCDGTPAQVVRQHDDRPLRVEPITSTSRERAWEALKRRILELRDIPFDLRAGPPLRTTLFRLGEREHVLLLVVHHMAVDVWSKRVLLREMTTLYEAHLHGAASPLAVPPMQFGEYAARQRQRLQGATLERLLSFWKRQLDGVIAGEAPVEQETTGTADRAVKHAMVVGRDATARLVQVLVRERVTMFMVVLLALIVSLHKRTKRTDIVIVATTANRTMPGAETVIGPCAQMVVLRTDVSGDPTLRELLGRVRRVTFDAYAHGELPITLLLEQMFGDMPGADSQYQASINMLPSDGYITTLPGLAIRQVPLSRGALVSRRQLHVQAAKADGELGLTLFCDNDVWSEAALAGIAADIETVLSRAVDLLDHRLSLFQ